MFFLPYRMQSHYNGRVRITDIQKITNNAKISDKQFSIPKDIKKLLKK